MNYSSRNRLIILASVLFGLLIIFGLITYLQRKDKYKLTINVVPDSAELQLNGKPIKPGGQYVEAGRYTITASLDNFEETGRTIDVSGSQEVSLLLTPVNEQGNEIAKKYQDEYLEAEARQAREAQEEGLSFIEKNPIVKNLPHKTSYYSINYGISGSNDNRAVVYIDSSSPIGRRVAIEKIYSWGFDPTNIEIVFRQFSNPFTTGGQR